MGYKVESKGHDAGRRLRVHEQSWNRDNQHTLTDLNSIDRRTVLNLTGTGIAGGITLVGSAQAQDTRGKGQGTSPDNAGPSKTYSWFLEGCQVVIAVIPVDSEALADHLPDGFAPQTPEGFGLPPDPRGDAVMGLEAFTCKTSAGLDGRSRTHPT